ncbi:MAG: lysine--tRNA ligase [Patescibacteria group bacterium]|nr:lysine--tRNA ligase [Patescibacteria group bacterium]
MQQDNTTHYWLDILISKIIEKYPEGELIVSSGISPSGPYHVGHAREILTADSIYRGLREAGRQVRHLHFVDAHDVLRKRYPNLAESYEEEAGKPLYKVPAPDGKSENYAKQYFLEYELSAQKLGVEMEIIWTNEIYEAGVFTELIGLCLKKRDDIAKILLEVSGREVSQDWQPIQILDESTGKLNTAKYIGYNYDTNMAHYIGSDNNEYFADASKGQIKLDWRLDWTARWKLYGVMIEGFGREHATKGGSYDTGVVLAEQIFGIDAPIPVPYDTINLKGESKKMSSSLGNLVTLLDSLEIIPPEVLRYFTFKSRPEKQLGFDPGLGLYALVDEYAKTESATLAGEEPEFKRAWQIASLAGDEHVVSTVPFSHMVTLYQTAQGDTNMILEMLKRTGHEDAATTQPEAIKRELVYIKNWIDRYAPENIKFEIQKKLPELEINKSQGQFLAGLLDKIESSAMQADEIHEAVYGSAVAADLKPAEAFKLIYRLFLNKDQGPKVGFFLSSLDKEFVLNRIAQKG